MSNTPTARDLLLAQLDMAWSLTSHHLTGLTTAECLWQPAPRCLHVRESRPGHWHAEWPEHERYDIGPPSIAWTTWHICFWWSKTLEHIAGRTALTPQDVEWAGTANAVRDRINELHGHWRALLSTCPEAALHDHDPESWPLPQSNLIATAAWVNVELMKNAAEIGMNRFLHAVQTGEPSSRHSLNN